MKTKYDQNRLEETVELLDGSRPGNRGKAAVRIEDLGELLNITAVKTQTLTGAPTMADFNSLLNDIREISTKLTVVARAVQKRKLG